MKIRRRCKCGCGSITNYGKMYIWGHNPTNKDKKFSKEHRKNLSISHIGNISSMKGKRYSKEVRKKMSLAHKGVKLSKEHAKNLALSHIKYDPNYKYCDIWKDTEYKNDIRKDYCENASYKKISNFLINHHIYLDKKRCAPNEVMTLCRSCHPILHAKLQEGNISTTPKDYIIINRLDYVSYIHKKSRKIIKMEKIKK